MVKDNPIADRLIEAGAIEFGEFTLASGATSPYYVDIKTAMTNPALLAAVAGAIADREPFEVVAGVAVGGVPLAVAVSLASGRPYAIVRSASKDHGRTDLVIGAVAGHRVLLVEDVTTSGGSAVYGINEPPEGWGRGRVRRHGRRSRGRRGGAACRDGRPARPARPGTGAPRRIKTGNRLFCERVGTW